MFKPLLSMSSKNPSFIVPSILPIRIRAQARRIAVVRGSAASHDIEIFSNLVRNAQRQLCSQLETIDGHSKFCSDSWESEKGEGLSRVLQNGSVFEKAGVNVSIIQGNLSAARADALRLRGRPAEPGDQYRAAALSFVIHAQSPFLPTLRGDVRMFATEAGLSVGGGVDLTIFYLYRKQVRDFHVHWKNICDTFDGCLHSKLKKKCDEYFFIPSRAEHRGVGGLFYDELPLQPSQYVPFSQAMVDNFIPSYQSIIDSNIDIPYTSAQKRWQRIRRGRYLEFNLLNDRGVRFGLAGSHHSRTDAIMISAPPSVEWPYRYEPLPQSPESEVVQLLRGDPVDWIKAT